MGGVLDRPLSCRQFGALSSTQGKKDVTGRSWEITVSSLQMYQVEVLVFCPVSFDLNLYSSLFTIDRVCKNRNS